jgi:hypothetical protein
MVQFTKTVSVLVFYFLEICLSRNNKLAFSENNKILRSGNYRIHHLGIF